MPAETQPLCNVIDFDTAYTRCAGFANLGNANPTTETAWVNGSLAPTAHWILPDGTPTTGPTVTLASLLNDDASDSLGNGTFTAIAGSSGNGSITFQQGYTGPVTLLIKLGRASAAYSFSGIAAGASLSFSDPTGAFHTASGFSHASVWGIPSAVPEADTVAMMLAGLGTLAVLSRRRPV